MTRSLAALLPIRNGQATLEATVHELLEILPELTPKFELIVVDDGSTDATIEVADELAYLYPQVFVVRHSRPLGRAAAIWTGLENSGAQVMLLRDEQCQLSLDPLARLWRASRDHEIVVARPNSLHGPQWLRWLPRGKSRYAGYQMLRRATLEQLVERAVDQPTLLTYLAQHGLPWCEVDVPHLTLVAAEPPVTKQPVVAPTVSRPNYLGLLNSVKSHD